jgi:hypothetical protein
MGIQNIFPVKEEVIRPNLMALGKQGRHEGRAHITSRASD